jgi:DNA mismatch repair protein MutS
MMEREIFMDFNSILFKGIYESKRIEEVEEPAFFIDLNLDQVINDITDGRQEYALKPFFYSSLHDIDMIKYRQEIFRDLENETPLEQINSFAQKMTVMRRYFTMIEKLYFENHKKGWFLEAALLYCDAVSSLSHALSSLELGSSGLIEFRQYLSDYINSSRFVSLASESKKIKEDLSTIRYEVIIKGLTIKVRLQESEIDYSQEIEQIFAKFKQGAVKGYKADLPVTSGMNHVEAQILDFITKLYPEIFSHLDRFCLEFSAFQDEIIRQFDREIQFYVAYLDYIEEIKLAGLNFCYPLITAQSKEIHVNAGFDIALAHKRIYEKPPAVSNDFYFKDKERVFIVSGPNQGGKTTFSRMFGQLHFLASLGCPIPGKDACLFQFDSIFTHFEKEEDIKNLRGKLQDDMVRIHGILNQATPRSIIIMNEIFTSTALQDSIFLSGKIIEKIIALDALCVCVTFIDELASLSEKTVSMVSTVMPDNPALRTYKILRKPADGLAYAISIAEKHHLTYNWIKERIKE